MQPSGFALLLADPRGSNRPLPAAVILKPKRSASNRPRHTRGGEGQDLGRSSKYVSWRCVDGDASRFDSAHDVRQRVTREIELIDGEGPGVAITTGVQSHIFADIGRANQIAAEIGTQGKVIEIVGEVPGLIPYAKAEIAGGGRAGRVQNLGSIAVPLCKSHVNNRPVGNRRISCALGGESDMPEANDGDIGWFALSVAFRLMYRSGGCET